MKLVAIALSMLVAATAVAQQAAAPAPQSTTVAVVNGETITAEKLDALYANIPSNMRAQYESSGGGKKAFLDNYVAKRLLIQEAMKRGFDERADVKVAVEAAKESALFDRYVRDVIAAEIVPESVVRQFYDDNLSNFIEGDKVKARHIVISWNTRSKEEARDLIQRVFTELQAYRLGLPGDPDAARQIFSSRFAEAARKYSEDPVAKDGGDLGWVERGRLDKSFEEAAFGMPPGIMSGIVASPFGYHLILVDDKKPAGPKPFDQVRPQIRDYLFGQKQAEIMAAVTRLTNELRRNSRVSVYSENLE